MIGCVWSGLFGPSIAQKMAGSTRFGQRPHVQEGEKEMGDGMKK